MLGSGSVVGLGVSVRVRFSDRIWGRACVSVRVRATFRVRVRVRLTVTVMFRVRVIVRFSVSARVRFRVTVWYRQSSGSSLGSASGIGKVQD